MDWVKEGKVKCEHLATESSTVFLQRTNSSIKVFYWIAEVQFAVEVPNQQLIPYLMYLKASGMSYTSEQ